MRKSSRSEVKKLKYAYARKVVRPFLAHLKAKSRQGPGGTSTAGASRQDKGKGKGKAAGHASSLSGGGYQSTQPIPIPVPRKDDVVKPAEYQGNVLGGIRIYLLVSYWSVQALNANTPRFDVMAAGLMLGLDFLDPRSFNGGPPPPMFRKLVACGEAILTEAERGDIPLPANRNSSPEYVRSYALDFMARMRNDFPTGK